MDFNELICYILSVIVAWFLGVRWGNREKSRAKWSNDFEKMCGELNNNWNELTGEQKYSEAVKAVENYVDSNRDRLMQLKSEATSENYSEFTAILLSLVAACVGTLSILISVFGKTETTISGKQTGGEIFLYVNSGMDLYGVIVALLIVLFTICVFMKAIRFMHVNRWRGYILTAIEELDSEILMNKDSNEKELCQ